MVARGREDGGGILHVGLVELFVVERALSVEVDDVAEVVEERWPWFECTEVALHRSGYVFLKFWLLDAAGVADGMEDELAGRFDRTDRFRPQDIGEVEPVGSRAFGRRERERLLAVSGARTAPKFALCCPARYMEARHCGHGEGFCQSKSSRANLFTRS